MQCGTPCPPTPHCRGGSHGALPSTPLTAPRGKGLCRAVLSLLQAGAAISPLPALFFPRMAGGRPAAPFHLGSGFEWSQAPSLSGCTKHAGDSLCLVAQPLSLLRSSSGRCGAFSLAPHPPFSSSPQRTPRSPWGPQGQGALTQRPLLSAGVWCHLVRSHQGCSAGGGPNGALLCPGMLPQKIPAG